MRFLGIGEYNDLAAMYHGLARRGRVAGPALDTGGAARNPAVLARAQCLKRRRRIA